MTRTVVRLYGCTGIGVRSVRIEDDPSHPIHDLPISVFICKLTTSFSEQPQHHSCLSSCPRVLSSQSTAQPIVRPQTFCFSSSLGEQVHHALKVARSVPQTHLFFLST